ncbi:isochorismatase family cysteine hydrolase [Sphingobium sp.]|uniref:cysteine hydrolase family protein n=1 Tax=Sphingobium sp. TaxID=1912891 RepID=UPI002C56B4F0|nr:isochorismatase family cysteine hydrolase [Sphingobium sp.]HUD93914.1 isochorismatase family cysteine hydrolase [Sphingobium sp.]
MIVGKPALLINEGQKGVIDPAISFLPAIAEQVVERGVVDRIAALAAAFRRHRFPVFHTPVVHRTDYRDMKANSLLAARTLKQRKLTEGTVEASYVDALTPQSGDIEIRRTSGFIAMCATQVDILLRRMDISTVVLVGVSTNVAIPGNAIVASDLGYHVVVPEDCIAASDARAHQSIIEYQLRMIARMVNSADLITALDQQVRG